jgi:hypothetical protein
MGFPLSVLCSRCPIDLDKPHILASAAETGLLRFKEQVLSKLKNIISAVQCERKTFQLIPLSALVDSRWTIPFFFKAYRILNNAKSESEDKKVKFNIFLKAYRIPNNAKAVSGSERKHIFGYTTLY